MTVISFWGKSRYWWALLVIGVLLIPCGVWLVASPAAGYAALSSLLGWALILLGVLELVIASDTGRHTHGWGWWIAGGILDILIGFLLVGNLVLSEIVLPYFFAFACYLSAELLGVNPFDQPGVEAYKQRMFRALGR